MEGQGTFVSGPLAVALHLTRIVGLAPLQFEKQGNGWKASLSTAFTVYGHLFMTCTSFVILTTVLLALKYQELASQETWSRKMVWIMEVLIVVITTAFMIHGAPGRMRRVLCNIYRLQEINLTLNVHYWPSEWTVKQIILLISWMTLSWLLIGADYATLITAMKLPEELMWIKATYALYYMYYGIIELFLMQFMLVVLHVRSTFKIINDSLKRMLQQENVKTTKIQQEMIQAMIAAYVAACDVVRDLNDSYGVMLVVLLASFFVHLVTTPYYFIMDLLNSETSILAAPSLVAYVDEMIQLSWCIFHAVNLMMLIEPCHVSHGEFGDTSELVSRLMVRARIMYDPLVVELEQFSTQLGLNYVTYKPLNVITLKRSLILTIFGSIVTYLVVLIDIK